MRRVLLIALLLVAAVPANASAKGLSGFTLCGPDGCRTTDLSGFGQGDPFSGPGEGPGPSAYFEVSLLMDDGAGSWRMFYAPAAGLLAYEDGDARIVRWMRPAPALATALKRAAKSVEPYPGLRITAVTVGSRRVDRDPGSYLALFAIDGPYADPGTGRAEAVVFETPVPSPWTSGRLWYYPDTDVVAGAGTWVRLPRSLATDLEAGRPLDPSSPGSARTAPVALGLAGAAVMIVVVASLLARRRGTRRDAVVPAPQ